MSNYFRLRGGLERCLYSIAANTVATSPAGKSQRRVRGRRNDLRVVREQRALVVRFTVIARQRGRFARPRIVDRADRVGDGNRADDELAGTEADPSLGRRLA